MGKCSQFNLNINIVLLSLFIMFCIANSIIIDNSKIFKGNNIISKPNTLSLIKIYQMKMKMKKVAHNELKILKTKRDKIDRSMKRLSILSKVDNENETEKFSLNNNLSLIISFSALCIGFIFAGVFLLMAYLLNEGITLKLDQSIHQLTNCISDFFNDKTKQEYMCMQMNSKKY